MPRIPLFRNDLLQLGRDSVHLRPTLVALDPEGSALGTVPWRLPLLPFFGYVEAGYPRSRKGKAGNPAPPGQDSSILILNVLRLILLHRWR